MTKEYTLIIIEYDEKCKKETRTIVDSFVKSIKAKNIKARIAYQGSKEEYIKTVDSFLDLGKSVEKPQDR
jgi:hypothetical protein